MPRGAVINIWDASQAIGRRLLFWAGVSMLVGSMWQRRTAPLPRAVGQQFVGWGAINAIIGLLGWRSARRRRQAPNAEDSALQQRERIKLLRLLWLNSGLDVGYVAGGLWLARRQGREDPRWRGHGWGIALQGGALLLFDLLHAAWLARRPATAVDGSPNGAEPEAE